ncbi:MULTISPECIES: nuclear transport factor 2 family protein [unclassified Phenylobacterium]|uniref:nuclear transport factor 2 family protein n=1 Tax=unclassified Phenylobacterium TaxID=2640670 RepID=UPI00083A7C7C|nr:MULTISPECIES: nuclear transport factor 2 family protein [unclassified Phenylobacterium]
MPPVLAPPAAQAVVTAYIDAIRTNDAAAYAKLFAPDVRIVSDWPAGADRATWLRAVSAEFAPTRTVRFLAVFSGFARFDGQPATRVLVVQELKDCRPGIVECFGQFRSETLFVRGGAIVGLERAGFTHRRLEPGGWTFSAP